MNRNRPYGAMLSEEHIAAAVSYTHLDVYKRQFIFYYSLIQKPLAIGSGMENLHKPSVFDWFLKHISFLLYPSFPALFSGLGLVCPSARIPEPADEQVKSR